MIFAARQLQEKCQEQYDDPLHNMYGLLTKAFDTMADNGKVWLPKKIHGTGSPITRGPRFLITVIQASESFPVTKGVKQGCVIALTLFSMVFSAMLHDGSQHKDDDIQFKYRTDGGVFNLIRLKANTKVKVATLRKLLFADGCALENNTEAEM